MSDRQVPRWSSIRPLLRTRKVELSGTRRRLQAAQTIDDLRTIARRRTPRAVFDYVDGAAEAEINLRRARAAFERVEFSPLVLRDVASIDTTTTILGRPSALPIALAPTGFTRLMNHEGEPAVVRAAAGAGIPYALSTMGTTSIEGVASAAPEARRWFQLYVWRDRGRSKEFIQRAVDAGYEALVLTVDVPVAGARLRDAHNGFTIPPTLTLRTVVDSALHPAWWFNLFTTEPLAFASVSGSPASLQSIIDTMFDPGVTFDDVAWMRDAWPHALVVKGIQTVPDARRVADLGADAIVVSNHGGRQLDRAPVPLELLPDVVDAVGDRVEVLLDTGVRTGSDVLAAVALGARACLVGRAYLYGLMAGGQAGVERAIAILTGEIERTMRLLGVRRVGDLDGSYARLRPPGG